LIESWARNLPRLSVQFDTSAVIFQHQIGRNWDLRLGGSALASLCVGHG